MTSSLFIKALKGLEDLPHFDIKWKFGSMRRIEGLVDCDKFESYDVGYPCIEESGKAVGVLIISVKVLDFKILQSYRNRCFWVF